MTTMIAAVDTNNGIGYTIIQQEIGMRTREHDWLDTKNAKPMYGLQVKCSDGTWRNVARDGEPAIFETKTERDALRVEMRKRRVG